MKNEENINRYNYSPVYTLWEVLRMWCGVKEELRVPPAVFSSASKYPGFHSKSVWLKSAVRTGQLKALPQSHMYIGPIEQSNASREYRVLVPNVTHESVTTWLNEYKPPDWKKLNTLLNKLKKAQSIVFSEEPTGNARNTYETIIGALLELYAKEKDFLKPGTNEISRGAQAQIINDILERFPGVKGLGKRNLEDKFKEALITLKKFSREAALK